jgi:hydroxyacylglutathione hydrolase
MEMLNISKRPTMTGLPDPKPLPPKAFAAARSRGAAIVDTRAPESFAGAHIEGSESIWMDGLAAYAGWLLQYDVPLLLVVEDQVHVETAVRTMVRLGFDNILGYLRGGMVQWCHDDLPFKTLRTASVEELKAMLDAKDRVMILDPRPRHEWTKKHLSEARHIFVGELEANLAQVPKDQLIASMCSVGYSGGMAAAILQRNGYEDVVNILGGVSAWMAAGYPVVKAD